MPTQTQQPQITPPIGSQKSTMSPPPFDPATADQQVIKVAQAIRNVESQGNYNAVGDNGSSLGAYQWNNGKEPVKPGETPINWQNAAKQFLGSPDAPMTPENQNYVAYSQIKAYKDQGLSPISIDALWNGSRPDPNQPGQYIHVAPKRAIEFNNALSNIVNNNSQANPTQPYQPPNQVTGDSSQPSVGGFLENTVKSGANFAGNIGEALLHPIKTIQNIGGAAVGGLQELGGQTNEETAKFDALKNFFVQRYGSVDKALHTAYTDPVGLAADVSAVLGVGAGAAGAIGKAGELGTAASVADTAGSALNTGVRTMAGDTAIGNSLTRGIGNVGSALSKGSEMANPLNPAIRGVSKVVGSSGGVATELASQVTGFEPQTIDRILKNPGAFTPEQIANTSRISIAREVESALAAREAELSSTGKGYQAFRESPVPVQVPADYLETQLRNEAKLEVIDGKIKATSNSTVRDSADINELQRIFNIYKPDFQNGTMDANKFLNLRQDLAEAANFQKGTTSNVERLAAKMRAGLNDNFRDQIRGLNPVDAKFAIQKEEYSTLRKGFLDREGNLTSAAVNKIANSTGKGKDLLLEKLEQITPGITKKIQVLKAIEDIQNAAGSKVGTYNSALLKGGGIIAGVATGNLSVIAASVATMIISSPEIAVPLIRALGANSHFVQLVLANLAKFATLSAVQNAITKSDQKTSQGGASQGEKDLQTGSKASTTPEQTPTDFSSPNDITKHPLYQQAAQYHSPQEIQNFLANNPDLAAKLNQ